MHIKKLEHRIKSVISGSIAEELGVETGDSLISINNTQIEDVFDYLYLADDDELVLLIRKNNGDKWELNIEKNYDEKLGFVFEDDLMSDYKVCHNDCNFCFVSQMPEGMRDTLYFKDDDYRLSLLQGNYVTLTNLTKHDVDRIIKFRLEPLNISIHTMNKKLRCEMLKNKFAGESLKILDDLKSAGLKMNAQIVLCKDYNDKEELIYSIEELMRYLPHLQSLTIVPVGLSKYRDNLTQFDPFTKDDAIEIIELVEKYQNDVYKKHGFYFIQASDEWYSMAGREVPIAGRYDGFMQLENGVGMLRLLQDEVDQALEQIGKKISYKRTISLATGTMAYPYIKNLAAKVMERFNGVQINVYSVFNNFFGDMVTVAGLVTGIDLTEQLKNKQLGDKLIIPINMLRTGQRVFLDDMTVEQVEDKLNIKIDICDSSGESFVQHIIYDDSNEVRNNENMCYVDAFNSYE